MKYASLELGTIEAVFNKLGGIEGAQRFLCGELECRESENNSAFSLAWHKVGQALRMEQEFADLEQRFGSAPASHWPIYVPEGLTCSKVVDALREAGSRVWAYHDDLDQEVTHNDRDPKNGSYAIQVKATVEADQDLKNFSAHKLKEQGHQGITLLERLLLELSYFLTTDQHLDAENITLCAGSRLRGGGVFEVGWDPYNRRVLVFWCYLGYRDDSLRARTVVSSPSASR